MKRELTPAERQLAERLRSYRQRAELTQTEMAERMGVHLRTYQQWEYGRRPPSAATKTLINQLVN